MLKNIIKKWYIEDFLDIRLKKYIRLKNINLQLKRSYSIVYSSLFNSFYSFDDQNQNIHVLKPLPTSKIII